MSALVVLLLAVFIGLGRWQWQRGEAKQATWEEYRRASPAEDLPGGNVDDVARVSRVALDGRFEPEQQLLLDNRSHAGQPGYEVLTPFVLSSGRRVLVNRGWVRFTGYRDRLPDVSFVAGSSTRITGRVDELPVAGLASGRAPPSQDAGWPRLTSFPTHEELEAALGTRITRRVLLLDPEIPQGFVREWSPPGLEPSRHFSYAVQWWGFALVLLVLYFGLNFRKVK